MTTHETKTELKKERIEKIIKSDKVFRDFFEELPFIRSNLSNSNGNEFRQNLGDFNHIGFSILYTSYIAYYYPLSSYDMFKQGKVTGRISSIDMFDVVAKNTGEKKNKDRFDFLRDEFFQFSQKKHWKRIGLGIPSLEKIDKENKTVRYNLSEVIQPLHYYTLGVLCGQIEEITGYFCSEIKRIEIRGEEKDKNTDVLLFELKLTKDDEIQLQLERPDKKELMENIDGLLSMLLRRKGKNDGHELRKELGDFVHISKDQAINYSLISMSQGNNVLTKWAGRKLGEKLSKKILESENKDFSSIISTLTFLEKFFTDLKIGVFSYELNPDRIIVRVNESLYSSGFKMKYDTKLCAFLSGLIHGALYKSTNLRWIVQEEKCIAEGNTEEYKNKNNKNTCEFVCRTEPSELLRELIT